MAERAAPHMASVDFRAGVMEAFKATAGHSGVNIVVALMDGEKVWLDKHNALPGQRLMDRFGSVEECASSVVARFTPLSPLSLLLWTYRASLRPSDWWFGSAPSPLTILLSAPLPVDAGAIKEECVTISAARDVVPFTQLHLLDALENTLV